MRGIGGASAVETAHVSAAGGTAAVWAARPALTALVERGIDPEPPLRAARLSRAALMAPDHRLPHRAVEQFWEEAARASGDASFGLHVAETLPRGSADIIEYLGSASATVGESFARLGRYVRIFYDHSNVRLTVEPHQARIGFRAAYPAAQFAEFSIALIVVRIRQWTGTDWVPDRARFQHARPDHDGELARLFRCPIELSAERNELVASPATLDLPHVNPDSRLLDILMRYADELLEALPARGDVAARASSAIARQIVASAPTLESIAQALRLNPRTLQRRLATQGLTFQSLLDEVRRGLALKYIGDAAISVAEIAYLLQFSESTAFARAFKRWTGDTPAQYRGRLLTQP